MYSCCAVQRVHAALEELKLDVFACEAARLGVRADVLKTVKLSCTEQFTAGDATCIRTGTTDGTEP